MRLTAVVASTSGIADCLKLAPSRPTHGQLIRRYKLQSSFCSTAVESPVPTSAVAAAALGSCVSPPSFPLPTASAGSTGACTQCDPTRSDFADVTCTILGQGAFAKRTARRAAVIAT